MNLIKGLIEKTGLNISQLARELTEFRGKPVYRQQVQDWLYERTGMRLETAKMLEEFKRGYRKRKVRPRKG